MDAIEAAGGPLDEGLALDSNYPHGSFLLGAVFTRQGRYAEAIPALR